MEKNFIILGTFLKKNKIDGCNFVERHTWLVWHNWAIWVSFHPFFSLKRVPAPVALPLLHGPVGMLWAVATEHQSTQGRDAPREEALCIDWSGGTRAGSLLGEGCHHLVLAAVAAQE